MGEFADYIEFDEDCLESKDAIDRLLRQEPVELRGPNADSAIRSLNSLQYQFGEATKKAKKK